MRQDLRNRIKKIKGQIDGVERMLDSERNCSEVVVQIQAARSALASLGQEIVKDEANYCIEEKDTRKQVRQLQSLVKELFKLS